MLKPAFFAVICVAATWAHPMPAQETAKRHQPSWESLDKRPSPGWFDDDKIGIFIHWSVFSVPAVAWVYPDKPYGFGGHSCWYGMYIDRLHPLAPPEQAKLEAFHRKTYGDVPFKALAPLFKAEAFDPKRWAELFKRSGARYAFLTSNDSPCKDDVVVNDRYGRGSRGKHGGVYCSEAGVRESGTDYKWCEDRPISRGNWSYNRLERLEDYLSECDLIHLLVETVAQGGNLHLDVSPCADGTIPMLGDPVSSCVKRRGIVGGRAPACQGTRTELPAGFARTDKLGSGDGASPTRKTTARIGCLLSAPSGGKLLPCRNIGAGGAAAEALVTR